MMSEQQHELDDEVQVQPETAAEAGTESATGTEELQRQRDHFYDLLLRKTADFDNFRKRTERERQTLAEATAADVMSELLPLLDDMERALKADAGAEGAEAYRRGVELIHKQLSEVLRKRGVRPIEAVGTDFDPHFHQAVSHEPAEGHRDGEVVEEFRRGYMIGDRLLRPSMVKVAKG
ncbi:MAG: nucleotide exchange factor GrpE [Acidobacteria bacterium]|nr:nucleotide exchange factor GrpE [Acidobacteriota bacterium]MCA1651811.1 nucleotide exchange factor GrpE [Acidobacteriota bacterium]